MKQLEQELKQLIIDALKLEDITADDIDSNETLFGEGLGLDSIDALELGVALRQRYNIQIDRVTEKVREHFRSVHSLAIFITEHQGKA